MPNSCRPKKNAAHDARGGRSNQTKETARGGRLRRAVLGTAQLPRAAITAESILAISSVPLLGADGKVGHHAFAVIREASQFQDAFIGCIKALYCEERLSTAR